MLFTDYLYIVFAILFSCGILINIIYLTLCFLILKKQGKGYMHVFSKADGCKIFWAEVKKQADAGDEYYKKAYRFKVFTFRYSYVFWLFVMVLLAWNLVMQVTS